MSTENKDGKEQSAEDKLKAAVEASATGTEDKGTEKPAGEEEGVEEELEGKPEGKLEGKSEHKIPKSRFDEVNTKYKEAVASKDLLAIQVAEANDKLIKLAEIVEQKDQDSQTLNEIKSFVNDPAMKEHVVAIDNRLRGIEQEVETGESTPEQAQEKTRVLLEQTRTEIADVQATATAEALVSRADTIADKLLAQLPETYNEQDRTIVQTLWTEKMDWDKAVENPDNLNLQLTEGFQEALDTYGTPRGALFTVEEVEELTPEKATTKTAEEQLDDILDKPWGALKTETLADGKTKVTPELSDDELNADMAAIIRKSHGR